MRQVRHADLAGKAITSLALASRLRRGQLLVQAHANTLRLLDLGTYQVRLLQTRWHEKEAKVYQGTLHHEPHRKRIGMEVPQRIPFKSSVFATLRKGRNGYITIRSLSCTFHVSSVSQTDVQMTKHQLESLGNDHAGCFFMAENAQKGYETQHLTREDASARAQAMARQAHTSFSSLNNRNRC